MSLKNCNINKDWTLFLDRDGVINELLPGNYVKKWNEFKFKNKVLSSLKILSALFGKIFIVTNQQGIGKGLMTIDELNEIHNRMKKEIINAGGRLDRIYFCPDLEEENSEMRKPKPGMAFKAQTDFPEIDFKRSIMLGDSLSDMQFGKNAGMKTVLIQGKNIIVDKPELIDFRFESLKKFADNIE